MDIKTAVNMTPILQAANPASLAALIPYAILKRHKKRSLLYLDKSEMQYVYFLVGGIASLYKLSDRHHKKVIRICGGGSLINEEFPDGKPASAYCEMLADSWVLCFERHRFLYVCSQDFELTRAVMDSMSLKIRRLYRQIGNAANTVRGDRKIAAKLWKLAKDYGRPCGRGIKIDFDLSVTFLADLLGSTRETVSRQVKMLTEKGLVVVDKNRFIIPDHEKLKKYFDEA